MRLLTPTSRLLSIVASLAAGCGGRTLGGEFEVAAGAAGAVGTAGSSGSGTGAGAGAGGRPNLPAPTRSLDSLAPNELEAVCLEDVRRTDLCMQTAIERRDPAACERELRRCSESPPVAAAIANCKDLRKIKACPVTVAEYFACVDAWNRTQVCENSGHMIETPPACEKVRKCEDFKAFFEQFGRPRACDPNTLMAKPPDTNDDIYGMDGCSQVPSRFVVLGHSNALAGGDQSAGALVANYIRETYAPGLEYQTHAALGSLGELEDLARQMRSVEPGPGHVAVWIFSFPANPETFDYPLWLGQLQTVFDYFGDAAEFPDGASFLLNAQYSPSDQCSARILGIGPALTPEQEQGLQDINRRLFIEPAVERADTVTIDHYQDWLGHAGNANVYGCPHCSFDNTLWQADQVHPNEIGRAKIADKWKIAVDQMYGGGCR
jgi:hypothetical protein